MLKKVEVGRIPEWGLPSRGRAFLRGTFYGANRFWIFYCGGDNLVYISSPNGEDWTEPTKLRSDVATADFLNIYFDGTYLHCAYGIEMPPEPLYYRRGIPNSDGTITWSADEQEVPGAISNPPGIAVDDEGYVWITYTKAVDGSNAYWVTKSGNNDGTWGDTPEGFPYQLSSSLHSFEGTIVPLRGNKMAVVFQEYPENMKVKAWTGSSWLDTVETTENVHLWGDFSAIGESDKVLFVFLTDSFDIKFYEYSYSSNSLSGETLASNLDEYTVPRITKDEDGKIHVIAPLEDNKYFIKTRTGTNWSDWTEFLADTIIYRERFLIPYLMKPQSIAYISEQYNSDVLLKFAFEEIPTSVTITPKRGQYSKVLFPGTIFFNRVPIYIGETEIGCISDLRLDIEANIEPYYSIESQDMQRFIEGNLKVTGTMRRAWVNIFYLQLLGLTSDPSLFNEVCFDLVIKASSELGSPTLYLKNCRFTSGEVRIAADGWLEEDYEFIAENVEVK